MAHRYGGATTKEGRLTSEPRSGTLPERHYGSPIGAQRSIDNPAPRRRQVGDVDPEARQKFQEEFAREGRPLRERRRIRTTEVNRPAKDPSFVTESGRVRTRKERIEYEVDKAHKG